MVSRTRACLFVMLLCASLNLQAAIKSSINHSLIEQGDSIRLSIDLENVDGDKIDLTPLEVDFEVLGRSQQSSTIIRNGQLNSSTTLVLTLLPKRAGDLQIPPISIDGEQTESHALRVSKVTQPTAVEGGIEMLSTLSSQQPKVQQPLVYQTSLLLGRQIFNATLQGPEITAGQALIEPLGDQRQYQQTLNGRQISVVEQAWLITPQQSGSLTISPARLIGQIQTGRQSRSPFSGGFSGFSDPGEMRRIQIAAQGYQLEVEPIPASFTGNTWLPAENLTLTDSWSSDQFMVGEPITRTITLHAEGVSRHQIAELALPDIDGIKQYASTPDVSQKYENDLLSSTLTLEVTLIPERAGQLILPELRIPWWDVKSNSEQTAILAARSIPVAAAKNVQRQPDPATASTTAKPQDPIGNSRTDPVLHNPAPSSATQTQTQTQTHTQSTPTNSVAAVPAQASSVATNDQSISIGWIAFFGALVGSLATLMIVWLLQRRARQQPVNSDAESPLNPPRSLSSLKEACHSHNAAAARLALIEWGQQFWPECSNLNQLSLRVSPELREAIAELHKHSYSQKSYSQKSYSQKTDQAEQRWQGDALWNAVQAFKGKEAANKQPEDKLAPLFLS
ncbi:BatD family protein [Neptunomonas qingdaonensis]|uniref:Oxygen tolerance n=1 Tax=Neptunomonas qingdaonensis TaxID=1045558 RepID=A0A1I2VBA8_9GAMM|nr:BatD family protein [Neptunomonas qingdaonensis]SFG86353.1 Oxygen tolerance [Neptunomonas qingdaonensis]